MSDITFATFGNDYLNTTVKIKTVSRFCRHCDYPLGI